MSVDITTIPDGKLISDMCDAAMVNQYLHIRMGQGLTHIEGRSVREIVETNSKVMAKIKAEIERRNTPDTEQAHRESAEAWQRVRAAGGGAE